MLDVIHHGRLYSMLGSHPSCSQHVIRSCSKLHGVDKQGRLCGTACQLLIVCLAV